MTKTISPTAGEGLDFLRNFIVAHFPELLYQPLSSALEPMNRYFGTNFYPNDEIWRCIAIWKSILLEYHSGEY